MKVLNGIGTFERDERGLAVTIGTFDGVHRGHRSLIDATRRAAAGSGARSAAITWDRHPMETLRPDRVPPLLTTTRRKLELLEECGLDVTALVAFTKELSHWPPERFVTDILVPLGVNQVVVGRDWRFGHKAAGDTKLLSGLGHAHGFTVVASDLIREDGDAVSSSRIRRAVAEGEMKAAAQMLVRPFDLSGVVIRGDARGRELGYPTANVALPRGMAHPPRGVYAGRASTGTVDAPAAINVGVNPTFGGDEATTPVRVEAYLLDFSGDLYDAELRVSFTRRLRDEVAFSSVDELLAQMAADVEAARTTTC
jgi:riboflavin kinase/FMN adenylyltransferase